MDEWMNEDSLRAKCKGEKGLGRNESEQNASNGGECKKM
jgi:hypothetical protein